MSAVYYAKNRREQIVAWLRVLVHRRVLHPALAGQDVDTLNRLLR